MGNRRGNNMMKLAIALAFIAASSAAPVADRQINDQKAVDEINALPDLLWTAGTNSRFNGQSLSSFKDLAGVKSDSLEQVLALPKAESTLAASDVPDEFDSEANWPQCAKVIGDIRDQSNCGCCWAFAGASAASDRLCIATNGTIAVPLSAEDICFCSSSNGCGGGQITTPWSFISEGGAVTGGNNNATGPLGGGFCKAFSLPHCHHHGPQGDDPYPAEGAPGCPSQHSASCPRACDADAKAPHNDFASDKWTFSGSSGRKLLGGGGGGVQHASGEAGIQKAIMEGGPVETAFTVYTDFANYASGIYHHASGSVEGGHAVRIVGWGVDGGNKYWKVANSWNPYWGEKGYFRIKRGGNECGIENGVTFSAATAKWSQKK